MPIPLPRYLSIKDNYCIAYFDLNKEYIVQLSLLRPIIESKFQGLKIYISCRDEYMYLLEGEERICPQTDLVEQRRNFAYVREIKNNIEKHPVEHLMEESDIECGPITLEKKEKRFKNTAIFTNGYFPTRSLNFKQIDYLTNSLKKQGVAFELNPRSLEKFDTVIGVENEYLYKAASLGIDTTLIPTGNGENLFLKMFPNNQIKYIGE